MDPHVQDFEELVLRNPNTKKKEEQKKPKFTQIPSVAKISFDKDGIEQITLKHISHQMSQCIIDARLKKGMKQIDLANKTNLDQKTISEIERGKCLYNPTQINRIAKALGVNIPRE